MRVNIVCTFTLEADTPEAAYRNLSEWLEREGSPVSDWNSDTYQTEAMENPADTSEILFGDDASGPYRCQNCGNGWAGHELCPVEDVGARVAAGEPMPAGECPQCGALCHEEDES